MKFTEKELERVRQERMEEIDKWLDNEYGTSYTKLSELHDFFFEKYTDQKEEIERLKEDNEYLNKVNIELSSRNSKAMKYINEKQNDDDNWIDYELLIEPLVLIEILRGSDKE